MDLYSGQLFLGRVVPESHHPILYRQSDHMCFRCDNDMSARPSYLPALLEERLFPRCRCGELRLDGNVGGVFRGVKYAHLMGTLVPLIINRYTVGCHSEGNFFQHFQAIDN